MKAKTNLALALLLTACCSLHQHISCADSTAPSALQQLNRKQRDTLEAEYNQKLEKKEKNSEDLQRMADIAALMKNTFESLQKNPADPHKELREQQINTWNDRFKNIQLQKLNTEATAILTQYADVQEKLNNNQLDATERQELLKKSHEIVHAAKIVHQNITSLDPENREADKKAYEFMMQSQIHNHYNKLLPQPSSTTNSTIEPAVSASSTESSTQSNDTVIAMPSNAQPQQGFFASLFSLFSRKS